MSVSPPSVRAISIDRPSVRGPSCKLGSARRRPRVFQFKRSKVKVTGHQKPQEIATYLVYMITGGRSSTGGSGTDCKLGLTIVRPNLYCQRLRRSATVPTAAYHVGTRRRHLFLLLSVAVLRWGQGGTGPPNLAQTPKFLDTVVLLLVELIGSIVISLKFRLAVVASQMMRGQPPPPNIFPRTAPSYY